jgi:hypothetical protein
MIKELNYIDIADLSDFLRSDWAENLNLDGNYMQIIEEVVFLCINDDFIKDIGIIRKKILKKYPKFNIPTSIPHQASEIVCFVYENFYKDYKDSIKGIIEKYKLLSPMYHQEEFMEDTSLQILDSIIFLNKPFDNSDAFPFWANPYFTKKTDELGGITIKITKDPIPYLEIGFPPYANIQEMQKIIKKNYDKIQEYRNKNLPLLKQRDHRKDNLPKMIDAYMLSIQGKSKEKIAIELDKKYENEISFEGVNQLIKRIKSEAKRFNKEKQET